MPWSFPDNIPKPAINWSEAEQKKCVAAANAVLSDGGSEQDAIFACIHASGRSEESTDRWVDVFMATQVLDGEPVRLVPLMPKGFHRGGVQKPPITSDMLRKIVDNWGARATSGFYQSNIPLNIEHEHGKIGKIKDLEVRDDGVYATFLLTVAGKQQLVDDEFDYLSPEIRWQTIDIETGEDIGPTVAGAAVTNYPFFGDRAAMFSQAAETKIAKYFGAAQGTTLSLLAYLIEIVRDLGWRMEDLALVQEESDVGLDTTSLSEARLKLLGVIAEAAQALPDMHTRRELLELFASMVDGGDGQQYPQSAFIDIGSSDEPMMLRVQSYQAGRLSPDTALMAAFTADTVVEPTGGTEMPDNPGEGNGGLDMEAYATRMAEMESRLTDAEAQAEQYRTGLEERDGTIASQGAEIVQLRQDRLLERFTNEAAGYTAIGAETPVLANHMLWMYQADATDGRAHYAFFSELLTTVDQGLAQSEAFKEAGTSQAPTGSSAVTRVEAKVYSLAQKRGITAVAQGTEEWNTLLTEVFKAEPHLFDEYRESVL